MIANHGTLSDWRSNLSGLKEKNHKGLEYGSIFAIYGKSTVPSSCSRKWPWHKFLEGKIAWEFSSNI